MLWKIFKSLRCISSLSKKHLETHYDKEHVTLQREFCAVITSIKGIAREEDDEFCLCLLSESKS